jgi:pimeloyl-ACP methyl ester carboxylesterase
VAEIADQFELKRYAIVGVSGGVPQCARWAARIPERINGMALVCALGPLARKELTDGMVALNRLALAAGARAAPLACAAIGLAAHLVRRQPMHYFGYMLAGTLPADRWVLVDRSYRRLFADSMAVALRQGGRHAGADAARADVGLRLEEVRTPVRTWHGFTDNITLPAMARHLAASLPLSVLHCVAGEGGLSLTVRHLDAVLADL